MPADKSTKASTSGSEARASLAELKAAAEAEPYNVEALGALAKAYKKASRFDDALACWYQIEELLPEDPRPPKMLAKLIIGKNRYRAIHGEFPEPRDSVPEKKKRATANPNGPPMDTFNLYRSARDRKEPVRREIELTDWQRLERQVNETPGRADLYLELADYYIQQGREYNAEKILAKGIEPTENPEIRRRWEEMALLRSQKKLELAERRISVEGTEASKNGLAEAQQSHQRMVLDIYNSRMERDPDDQTLRFDFGMQLKRAGKTEEAYDQLSRALDHPEHKAGANLAAGECLQRLKKYGEALQLFRHAIEMSEELQQEDYRKLALYRAGTLAVAIKLIEPAQRYLSELVALDPVYRDAAAKLTEIESAPSA